MVGELLGGEHEFAVWAVIGGFAPLFVKGVDDQVAVDLGGRTLLGGGIEHHPAEESARRATVSLVKHALGPSVGDGGRCLRFAEPGDRPAPVR